jgi:ribonuclease P protein subunit POP4
MSKMIKDILKRELIGQKIIVIESKNKSFIRIHGKVIDETKNMLVIYDGKQTKAIPKNEITIETTFEGKKIRFNGKEITKKPEDRIKSR